MRGVETRDVDLDDETRRRITAEFALRGEKVVLSDVRLLGAGLVEETQAVREARSTLFSGRELTVERTVVVGGPDATSAVVHYVFEGMPGEHVARAFKDPGEHRYVYGVLIRREGVDWAVCIEPRTESGEVTSKDDPMRLTPTLPRFGKFWFGVDGDPDLDDAPTSTGSEQAFFAEMEANPKCGELTLHKSGDEWRLVCAPWWSDATSDETRVAEDAIQALAPARTP